MHLLRGCGTTATCVGCNEARDDRRVADASTDAVIVSQINASAHISNRFLMLNYRVQHAPCLHAGEDRQRHQGSQDCRTTWHSHWRRSAQGKNGGMHRHALKRDDSTPAALSAARALTSCQGIQHSGSSARGPASHERAGALTAAASASARPAPLSPPAGGWSAPPALRGTTAHALSGQWEAFRHLSVCCLFLNRTPAEREQVWRHDMTLSTRQME